MVKLSLLCLKSDNSIIDKTCIKNVKIMAYTLTYVVTANAS